MSQRIKTVVCVILFIPIWFFLYAFLHEAGHALVGLAYGGTIENFVFWNVNAHVGIINADLTSFGASLMNSAGMLLPVILGAIAIAFYKPHVKFIGYHFCFCAGSVSLVFTMLTWVVIPIISLFTYMTGEDTTHFLNSSGIHPILVSAGALILVFLFIFLLHKKGLLRKAKELYNSLREYRKTNRKRAWLYAVIVLLFLVAAALFVVNNSVVRDSLFNRKTVIFSVSIHVDDILKEDKFVFAFDIEETKEYDVELDMKAHGVIAALSLAAEDGDLVYRNLGEESLGITNLILHNGRYILSVEYLADFKAVEDFLQNVGEVMNGDEVSSFLDVFSHRQEGSAYFSIIIR